jgi:hypothetical protein
MTLASANRDSPQELASLVFQIEVLANSEGGREICSIECDPTTDEPADGLDAHELGEDSWEFIFTVPASFDGTEPVFRKFRRYRLDPDAVVEACTKAAALTAGDEQASLRALKS